MAKNSTAAKIIKDIYDLYGQNVMNYIKFRQRCYLFCEGRTNICNEERRSRATVITDDLLGKVT